MKKSLFILFALIQLMAFGQKKYQSLLWEISGNGLNKKSYLYGTMHVSQRVAFHLSDAFFQSLQGADYVALESDPERWLEEYKEMGFFNAMNFPYYYNSPQSFYSDFYLKPSQRRSLDFIFFDDNSMINNILFREYKGMEDYTEETYLDMFIYQSGKKLGKQVVGLEKFKESMQLATMASKAAINKPNVKKPWYEKLVKDKNPQEVMLDAYRNKDLDLIDSLGIGMDGEEYRKYMLYERNKNMVKAMDSLMKKGSLFAGIGAAHLPGNNGTIELLRKKGYTVKPLLSAYTELGKKMKENIENTVIQHPVQKRNVRDNAFSVASVSKFFNISADKKKRYLSLDVGNGAYLSVSRFNPMNFLQKGNDAITLQSIDSLLFENIPGKITSKKEIIRNGYKGFDVENIKDNGDKQRRIIMQTPLEIIAFNLIGKKEYVPKMQEQFISQLQLKSVEKGWQEFEPDFGGFSVTIPKYFINYQNEETENDASQPEIYAYDAETNSYYFLLSKPFTTNFDNEKAEYDLKRILYEFNANLDIDTLQTSYTEKPYKTAKASATLNTNKKLFTQTTLSGNHYYLLGAVTENEQVKDKFFNSFKIQPFKKHKDWKAYKDTILMFSLDVPVKPASNFMKGLYQNSMFPSNDNQKDSVKLLYREEYLNLYDENGEMLTIGAMKNPKYRLIKDGKTFAKYYIQNEKNKFCEYKIDSLGGGIHKNGYQYLDYAFKDSISDASINVRFFHKDNKIYELVSKHNINTQEKNKFIEHAYQEIQFFNNTDDENSLALEKKYGIEYTDDTEKNAALLQIESEYFWETPNDKNKELLVKLRKIKMDEAKIKEFITQQKFTNAQNEVLIKAIITLASTQKPNVDFWKNLYQKNHLNSNVQAEILQAITITDKETGMNQALKLLEDDFPAIEADKLEDIIAAFWTLKQGENKMLPFVLNYTIEQSEMFDNSLHYLYELSQKNQLKKSEIKSLKSPMLSKAIWLIKKHSDAENTFDNSAEYYDDYQTLSYENQVKKYAMLFNSLKMNNEYHKVLSNIRKYNNKKLLSVFVKENLPITLSASEFDTLYKNPALRTTLHKKYKQQFGKEYPNKQHSLSLDEAKNIFSQLNSSFKPQRDSIILKDKFENQYNKINYLTYMFEVYNKDENAMFSWREKKEKSAAIITFITSDEIPTPKIAQCELLKQLKEHKRYKRNYEFTDSSFATDSIATQVDLSTTQLENYNETDNKNLSYKSPYKVAYNEVDISLYNEDEWKKLRQKLEDYLQNREHKRANFRLTQNDFYNNYMMEY